MIDVDLWGVLHGIAAALTVFKTSAARTLRHDGMHCSHSIVPDVGLDSAAKNAVRTVMEALLQESIGGAVRTTSISPGFMHSNLDSSIDNAELRLSGQIRPTVQRRRP